MPYLICDECEGYYELSPGESADDFSNICECGGNLKFTENLPVKEEKPKPRMKSISNRQTNNNIISNGTKIENYQHEESYQYGERHREKSPIIALILSFFIVGLGQLYNGHTEKGIILLAAGLVFAFLSFFIIGMPFFFVIWAFNMYDAFDSANRINKGKPVKERLQDYF